MTQDEIIELAIQGHASTRDAIRWAMNQAIKEEREACAKLCDDRVTAYRYATDSWAQEHIDEARHLASAIRSRSNT